MGKSWWKSKAEQLDLLAALSFEPTATLTQPAAESDQAESGSQMCVPCAICTPDTASGQPLMVLTACLSEDPDNPRTEFPQADLDELSEDIRQHGILQPIVVHPADAQGNYRIHFGAKRSRAAKQLGLTHVPITIRAAEADPYAQVAENQKRRGLSAVDLARFIAKQVDEGGSYASIAKRLGMDQTSVTHHFMLLSLPPVLDAAMRSGRCTSPRALYELSKMHDGQPERVAELLASDRQITRDVLAVLRMVEPADIESKAVAPLGQPLPRRATGLLTQADALCARLDVVIARMIKASPDNTPPTNLAALQRRLVELSKRLNP